MKERRVGDLVYVGETFLTSYHIIGIQEGGLFRVFCGGEDSKNELVVQDSQIYATESLVKCPETCEPTNHHNEIALPPKPDEGKPVYNLGDLVCFEVDVKGAGLEVRGFVVGVSTTYTHGIGQGTPGYNYTVYSISELGCLRTKIWLVPKSSIKGLSTIGGR